MKYDYVFAGAGCAALSLVYRLNQNPAFKDKKILLIDQNPKNQNDRTWCFWTNKPLLFDEIVYHTWDKIWFKHSKFSKLLDIQPYSYKMIRGIDFYEFILKNLNQNPNIEWQFGEIESMRSEELGASLIVDNQVVKSNWIFNSIPPKIEKKPNYHYFLQHFKGWVVETEQDFFKPEDATLMDFRIPQMPSEARFFYVLPSSPRRALIEFTVFSQNLLAKAAYELALKDYFQNYLQLTDYQIIEEEFGIIPMYDEAFAQKNGDFIFNLGTAGGRSKASTGYTFMNIQKQSDCLMKILAQNPSKIPAMPLFSRFRMYDRVLLDVLEKNRFPAAEIFRIMFEKHPIERIWHFLDEESSFSEEFLIMNSMPWSPFLQAVVRNVFV